MTIPNELGFEHTRGEGAYYPFPLALEEGMIDTSRVTVHRPSDAAVMIINGRMPDQGGIVELQDGLGAVDFVGARFDGRKVNISTRNKSVVNDETDRIEGEGFSVLTFPGGDRLRIFAFAIEARRQFGRSGIGRTAVVKSLGLDSIDLELVEVDSDNGHLITKPRNKLF